MNQLARYSIDFYPIIVINSTMENLKILVIAVSSLLLFTPQSIFAQRKQTDLIIQNGTIVTMDGTKRVIENGAVAVQKGKIVGVGTVDEIKAKFASKQIVDATGKMVIPGLINTHTHIPMSLFRGIADDLDLQDWLTKYIFPAEGKNVTEDFVRAGTQLGLAEMIRGGTTTYCDMYYFEDAIADETFKAGVRGVLGETIIDFPVADNKTNEEAMIYAEKFVTKWKKNKLIIPAIAPHAPYTVSTEHLSAIKKLSDKLDCPIVIHVAETRKEVADSMEKWKLRPTEYLQKIGFLSDKVIAAHEVYPSDEEIDILKELNVGIAHCPQSNMKLASGVAPVMQMLAKDLRVGLGTDGAASNNDLDLWEEMDTAAKLHKVFNFDPKVVNAEQVFEMATSRGASALHLEKIIGSIEVGKRADLVIVDSDALHQTPMYNVYSHLVYSTKASDVRSVVIDGKFVMKDRRLLTLNEVLIKQKANLYREQIAKSLAN
jgi:5-methylthioadenosine/S-adenosylhomocysteine deaminase